MKLCPYIERFIERYCIDNNLGACYKSIPDITYHMVSASMACLACAQSLTWTLLIEGLSKATQMLQVNVALPNGHAELLSLPPSSTVQDLKTTAQQAFGRKCLRLITAKNRVLADPDKTLEEAEIEDGECLTALVLQPQLAATRKRLCLVVLHGD